MDKTNGDKNQNNENQYEEEDHQTDDRHGDGDNPPLLVRHGRLPVELQDHRLSLLDLILRLP